MRWFVVSIVALVAACQSAAPPVAPETPAMAAVEPNPAPEPKPVITGGYGAANEEAPGLKEARELAIAEIYRRHPTRALVAKVETEVQVVAGLNYRFAVTMSGDPAQAKRYAVVVYRDLKGKMNVTSLESVGP